MTSIAAPFRAECEELDELVTGLDEQAWRMDTPAVGWTIAHQIAHLAWTDEVALEALGDHEAFRARGAAAMQDPDGYVDRMAAELAVLDKDELLQRWRAGRERLVQALDDADPATKVPWFGPPMSPRSMATARLMETWAHGQDVADALGVTREPTERLRDVCHLGVRTRNFAFTINGIQPPAEEFRVELAAPSGETWSWGPEDAAQRVTGSAEDFALVATQRREVAQTGLEAQGEDAQRWLAIAQAFAGAPKSKDA